MTLISLERVPLKRERQKGIENRQAEQNTSLAQENSLGRAQSGSNSAIAQTQVEKPAHSQPKGLMSNSLVLLPSPSAGALRRTD